MFWAAASVEGGDSEGNEVRRFDELREDLDAVEGGVGGVVDHAPVVVGERTKRASSIPWLSVGPAGKITRSEISESVGNVLGVVGRGQPVDDLGGLEGDGAIHALPVEVEDGRFELFERELSGQRVEAQAGDVVERSELLQLGRRRPACRTWVTGGLPVIAYRLGFSIVISPPASITPERNSMDEMWPSPMARRLMTNRRSPASRPDLIGSRHDRRIAEGGRFD